MSSANIFSSIPDQLPNELVDVLADKNQVRIERIVSRGHASPSGFWYDQQEHEFVLLLQGQAELELLEPQERLSLQAGDYLLIPAHRKHRVVSTSDEMDCIWLAVFYHDRE
ncbi:cupin domain-containing protein [Pelovirga terrestris]|uniref:Cupin domain-containing protein n=1 Tax=Pelovirga terrestris TaxID=2771352 RepID=A0A8J6QP00_9BACT|nr:cupin domain-containing protein [Pelovirga terrestris]MBD1401332.1 cupin domain-containing protein [Pelovirga terrestris]